MEPGVGAEEEEGAAELLRRQAGHALHALVRPAAYVGTARELALGAFSLAAYPLGVVPAALRPAPWATAGGPGVGVLRRRPAAVLDDATAELPVVLVHGWFHNRSAFLVMGRALRRAGFRTVHDLNCNPLVDLRASAALLADEVDRVLERTGADRCAIVAHSAGGLVARSFVSEGGGQDVVDTVVTLGTPHRGTYTSYLGIGAAAAQMRPGSAFLQDVDGAARPGDVRYVAFWSDLDLLVTPAVHGRLLHPALRATNVELHDTGHLSLLLNAAVTRAVVGWLADREAGRPQPRGC